MALIKNNRFGDFIKKQFGAFKKTLSKAHAQLVYNFWKDINENEIAKASHPAAAAVEWYKKYKKDKDVQMRREFMKQGHLYIFDYRDPKYKDVLDFYDRQPLVLCLGQTHSVEYSKNNIGINLHLLPPAVRRIVLFEVWKMFSTSFKRNMYTDDTKQVRVDWKLIKKPLEKYGVDFAIRSYIPPRQKSIIEFRYEDWAKAIWIPSAGYTRTTVPELEKMWRQHIKKNRLGLVAGESHMGGAV